MALSAIFDQLEETDATRAKSMQELCQSILDEGLIGMAQAARLLKTHPATAVRYATRGVTLLGGQVVRLEVVRIGGKYRTSLPAVNRFVAAQQRHPAPHDTTAPRSPTRRNRESEKAAAELVAAGF